MAKCSRKYFRLNFSSGSYEGDIFRLQITHDTAEMPFRFKTLSNIWFTCITDVRITNPYALKLSDNISERAGAGVSNRVDRCKMFGTILTTKHLWLKLVL